MRSHRTFIVGAALVLLTGAAFAQTMPTRDTIVATQLLPRSVKASLRRQAERHESLAPAQRLALAQRMIEAGRANGDPRTLGYAEAVLAIWPGAGDDVPLDALVLRATIEGSRHRFAAARALLDRVLARAPAHAQALLTRATLAQVSGDYTAARADCARLQPLAADAAAICRAAVDAMTGANERALATARLAAARTMGAVRSWALAVQAQVLEGRGDMQGAAASYRAALMAADDLPTRLAYADLLLATGDAGATAGLLADAPETDGVLVRQWQATRAQLRRAGRQKKPPQPVREAERAMRQAIPAQRDAELAQRDVEGTQRDAEGTRLDAERTQPNLELAQRNPEVAPRDVEGTQRDAELAQRHAELTQREAELATRLQDRFAAAAARGELLHVREAALFALERGDATQALALARENWQTQREVADLWLLARAARAADDRAALTDLRAWVARTGLDDRRIDDLLRGG
ncbi:MAG TPA: hypothetical protein VFR86_30655 [Burkholderiaceae bacterium]|nr:hypothetical protein [Burkholderiaceae bacterium]